MDVMNEVKVLQLKQFIRSPRCHPGAPTSINKLSPAAAKAGENCLLLAAFHCLSEKVHLRLPSKILPTQPALQPAYVATSDGTSKTSTQSSRGASSHRISWGSAEWRAKAVALLALNHNDASSFHPSATNLGVADELANAPGPLVSGSDGSFARASCPAATKTTGCSTSWQATSTAYITALTVLQDQVRFF